METETNKLPTGFTFGMGVATGAAGLFLLVELFPIILLGGGLYCAYKSLENKEYKDTENTCTRNGQTTKQDS